jgi:hypothetical protein
MVRKLYLLLIPFCMLFSVAIPAQQPMEIPGTATPEYARMKQQGAFPRGPFLIFNNDSTTAEIQPKIQPNTATASVLCHCMTDIDSTFSVVPFTGGFSPEYRNDDGSSPLINLPFSFCFYGQTMNSCFINNNGNISFLASYGTFTANSFPDPSFIMIAPFWGDVDTRNALSGLVYYKITPTYMIT